MIRQTSRRLLFQRNNPRKKTVNNAIEVTWRARRKVGMLYHAAAGGSADSPRRRPGAARLGPAVPRIHYSTGAMLSIYTHPIFHGHDTGAGHPESAAPVGSAPGGGRRAGPARRGERGTGRPPGA